uniref:Spindle and kinetochore-associated protein 3 n=1 Tax=Kalanchoe fedtschenkoi TaxID=63787 RepID=A0A7N1A7M5_KALFE
MDDSISTFCNTLASFCTHLQTNCDALTESVQRRPIPLSSATSTFIRALDRRVAAANDDLNLLESMSFATVSFEELLGHCHEVFKSNQAEIDEIEDRLKDFGYFPGTNSKHLGPDDRLDSISSICEPVFAIGSTMKAAVKDDPIESFSLKNLGISDISLANLASEGGAACLEPDPAAPSIPKAMINVSKDDYENLPSHIRCLATWEDLLIAVEKLNRSTDAKKKTGGSSFFRLDELEALELGPKGRSYLLLLVRMNRLVVETIDGLISYRVV